MRAASTLRCACRENASKNAASRFFPEPNMARTLVVPSAEGKCEFPGALPASARSAFDAQAAGLCEREIHVDVISIRIVHVDLAEREIVDDPDPVRNVQAFQPCKKPLQVFGGEGEMLQPQ